MKDKIITTAAIIAISWTCFYLLGSFAQASFDISTWTTEARSVVSLWGGFVFVILAVRRVEC